MTLQRCEDSSGSGHRHFLKNKALAEARAEERNFPKKVHFIGDGYPRIVTGSPVEPGKSRAARAGLLHAHTPHKAGRKFRPNKVKKKKSGKRNYVESLPPKDWVENQG